MKLSPYRVRSQEVIKQVIQDHPDATDDELRAMVSKAYPFDMRRGWAYKQWLREVKEFGLNRGGPGPDRRGIGLTPQEVKNFWLQPSQSQ